MSVKRQIKRAKIGRSYRKLMRELREKRKDKNAPVWPGMTLGLFYAYLTGKIDAQKTKSKKES